MILAIQYAPLPMWLLWTVVIVGGVCLAAITLGSVIGVLARIVRQRDLAALAIEAADHDEPARRDIEVADRLAGWQEHCRTAFEQAMGGDLADLAAWEREMQR